MPDRTRPTAPRPYRRRAARRLRAALWRSRYVLAAVCCGLAATLVVQALRPPPPPTVDVLVASHRLAAGESVDLSDLTTRSVAAALVPDDVLTDPDAVVGLSPAVTLPAGMPLHADLVGGGGVVAQAPRGTVVVPVRLDDATAGWLRAGDRVDLLALTGEPVSSPVADDGADEDDDGADDQSGAEGQASGDYLARRALVLPPPPSDPGAPASGGGLLGGADTPAAEADVTLVAVSPKEAPRLTAASGWGSVGAVLVP